MKLASLVKTERGWKKGCSSKERQDSEFGVLEGRL